MLISIENGNIIPALQNLFKGRNRMVHWKRVFRGIGAQKGEIRANRLGRLFSHFVCIDSLNYSEGFP
jgi:hypothetical protein